MGKEKKTRVLFLLYKLNSWLLSYNVNGLFIVQCEKDNAILIVKYWNKTILIIKRYNSICKTNIR